MKSFMEKTVYVLDHLTDLLLLLVSTGIFLAGLYGLYDSYLVYRNANDDSILKYKPGYDAVNESEKKIQGHMVAWLTLDHTKIDYPVMQGENNTEYLNKDPFGDYSLSGSIFLDSRNDGEFQDDYSLIYGHHMEGGMMFGALDKYLKREYFDTHRSGTLSVGEKTYKIRIFAVVECEATEEAVFSPEKADVTLAYIEKHFLYLDKEDFPKEEKLIGLSTCKYPAAAERTIVFGVLSEKT